MNCMPGPRFFTPTWIVMITVVAYSCQMDRDKLIDRSKFTFRTYDDTEIFFKNMRASYYSMEEVSSAKLQVYRFDRTSEGSWIKIAIVMNWREDMAYIVTELDELLLDEEPLTLAWTAPDGQEGKIYLEERSREGMLEFATQVYEGIRARHTFRIILLEEPFDFLSEPEDREAFRITVSDYYRLTRVF